MDFQSEQEDARDLGSGQMIQFYIYFVEFEINDKL